MADTLRFAYDKDMDILDISLGRPRAAISREVDDDVFVRLDHKSRKVIGFSILNFTKWFKELHDTRPIPVTGHFSLARS
jgi:uncharacterized protein YuzE